MKQVKPANYPKPDEQGRQPAGTHPLPMTVTTRARRAMSRRARGKHGGWLNREPFSLSGAKGRGGKK